MMITSCLENNLVNGNFNIFMVLNLEHFSTYSHFSFIRYMFVSRVCEFGVR
jgi:hypothetical protein